MKDPKRRLGHESSSDVKNHAWFSGINWNDFQNKKVILNFF